MGSRVWVADSVEGWVKGQVTNVGSQGVTVQLASGESRTLQADDLPLQNPDTNGVEVRSWSWGLGALWTGMRDLDPSPTPVPSGRPRTRRHAPRSIPWRGPPRRAWSPGPSPAAHPGSKPHACRT